MGTLAALGARSIASALKIDISLSYNGRPAIDNNPKCPIGALVTAGILESDGVKHVEGAGVAWVRRGTERTAALLSAARAILASGYA